MLILPLHKPLSLATFPCVTALLVLVNVLIYFGWQVPDEDKVQAAQAWYLASGLDAREVPAYRKHLIETGQVEALQAFEALPARDKSVYLAASTQTDVAFHQALQHGELFETEEERNEWAPLHQQYQSRLDQVFTLRHLLRSSEWSLPRMFSSAFLHGDALHLFGNMVLLVALGLLLEGAIGSWRFLAVYLLGALGSSAVSVLWRWGEAGGGLGASGAIAAVMGAFCVVWGLRPVRFFYWFGILFNYVRAPAIWLLPVWLGWEVFNLFTNQGAGIGFDAHAGGLVCGALLGGVLVLTHQTRESFMREDEVPAAPDTRWEQALLHMGRMENAAAERLLAALAAEQPHRLDVALARLRVADNDGRGAAAQARLGEAMMLEAADPAERAAQHDLVKKLQASPGMPPAPTLRAVLARCFKQAWLAEAEALLLKASGLPEGEQAQLWLRLALRHGELHAPEEQRRLLDGIARRYPGSEQAGKARFLLENN